MRVKKPKISVLMSVYNAEKYLSQSINSILQQSFKDFEFIIIDDHSTDNSLAIIKSYLQKDDRIRLIEKPKNKGMEGFIENLNIGLSNALGQYIARMDADDIAYSMRFEKQISFLENHKNIFMVGSSINIINENNQFIRHLDALEKDEDIKKQMPKSVAMYHPVIMFRNDKQVRYREKIFYCEDYDLYFRLMNQGKKFYNIQEPLLDYRILNSSISRKDGNFKRTLFVEKTRKIYFYEKKNNDYKLYDSFFPNQLLSILDDSVSTYKDLNFALNVATKFKYKKEFKTLIFKMKKYNLISFRDYLLIVLNIFPRIFSKVYYKLISI